MAHHLTSGGSRGHYSPLPSFTSHKLFHSAPEPPSPPARGARQVLRYLLRPSFLLLLLVCVGLLVVRLPGTSLSLSLAWLAGSDSATEDYWKAPDATFGSLFAAARSGWRPYEPARSVASSKGDVTVYRPTEGESWSGECLEDWARGKVCPALMAPAGAKDQIDLLWTWTNGSDPLLLRWRWEVARQLRAKGSALRKRAPAVGGGLNGRVMPQSAAEREIRDQRHYREHDELRYSLRSALKAFLPASIARITLLTTDLPANVLLRDLLAPPPPPAANSAYDDGFGLGKAVKSSRVGQVPTWLLETSDQRGEVKLEVMHHRDLFADPGPSRLPTFNSLAIESQFGSLPSNGAEFVLYMNDDTFLLGEDSFAPSDVGSSLYGPVFRLQRDFGVDAKSPDEAAGDAEGEWPGLRRANWLLNRRFGVRTRAYLAHLSKTFSAPLLHEMSQLWQEELDQTSSSRFRGHRPTEYQTLFLATHYVIESHRQALLYSFFFLRADTNLDGSLSLHERRRLLTELGFDGDDAETDEIVSSAPRRATKDGGGRAFKEMGLRSPGSTKVLFDSRDGFAMMTAQGRFRQGPPPGSRYTVPSSWPVLPPSASASESDDSPPMCSFSRSHCLGLDFLRPSSHISTSRLFRRVAFELPECGDCAILLLTRRSSLGLDAILPLGDLSSPTTAKLPLLQPFVPLGEGVKDHADLDLSRAPSSASRGLASQLEARRRALRLIRRYAYVVGDTESRFVSLKMPHLVEKTLRELDEERGRGEGPALITLNDDMQTEISNRLVGEQLTTWFSKEWPEPSSFERAT